LYFTKTPELRELLDKYALQVQPVPDSDRVPYLLRLLEETAGSRSRSSSTRRRDERAKTPIPQLDLIHQLARSGTPPVSEETDNDTNDSVSESRDDEFETPPQSPTLNAIDWANRRRERQRHAEKTNDRKRRSDEALSNHLHSPKYTRSSSGRQSSISSTNYFSAYSEHTGERDIAAPPFESQGSANTEAFPSFTSSVLVTARDGATTANTSFTSIGGPVSSHGHKDSTSDSLDYSSISSDALHSVMQRYDFTLDQNLPSSGSLSWDSEMRNEVMNIAQNCEASMETLSSRLQRMRLEHPVQNGQNLISPEKKGLTNDSPIAEHHQIRDLPRNGLFVEDGTLPFGRTSHLPFRVRYECARIAVANGLPINELLPHSSENIHDYDAMWKYFENQSRSQSITLPRKGSTKAWAAAKDKFENVYFGGRLAFNTKSNGPMFTLSLDPMEFDLSCRFHRAFGGDRFLYLLIPSMQNAPQHLRGQRKHLRKRFVEWMLAEKVFLGRHWRAIYMEDSKRRGKRGKDYSHRIVLFATEGLDILPEIVTPITGGSAEYSSRPQTSVEQLFNWFMPLEKNKHQPYCKAFARISLGFSRTIPTLHFHPDQVRWVPDVLADRTPESVLYDDPNLNWDESSPHDQKVMNDGCAKISYGACRRIWQMTGKSGPLPSTFQARINGAKGVWIRNASVSSESDDEIWIEISDSQRKFFPHDEDIPQPIDPNRWTFEVLRYSHKLDSAALHLSFVPILLDRGVHLEELQNLVIDALNKEKIDLQSAVKDPVRLRAWINQHYSGVEESMRTGGIRWQAGLPFSLAQKIILLLESGFHPMKLPYLAQLTVSFAEKYFAKVKSSLSVRVGRSTNAIGIADPIGVLEPGEIHLAFSENFIIEASGESLPFLDNIELVVARHPALRRSDVQKVRAVYKTELSHLFDVIVFPSRGHVPLASKLQGGDYDGDVFWVCWEPALTRGFMNAPAPLTLPAAVTYGIGVDKRTLEQISTIPYQFMDNFLGESFTFAYTPNLLGLVTLFLEKLAYAENSIHSPGINMIADLHDYLIDATKNGYRFDYQDFTNLIASSPLIRNKKPPTPAYKLGMNVGFDTMSNAHRWSPTNSSTERPQSYNPNHVVDHLFFRIVEPHLHATINVLKEGIKEHGTHWDEDLQFPYLQEHMESETDHTIRAELRRLKQSLENIYLHWARNFRNDKPDEQYPSKSDIFNTVLGDCYNKFTQLQPQNLEHPIISRWTRERIGKGPSRWSLIKASALFIIFHEKPAFTFGIAGKELAYIKAHSKIGSRMVVESLWAQMKPRPIKNVTELGSVEETEFTASFGLSPEQDFQVPSGDDDYESDQDDFYSTIGDWASIDLE
jgi:hypothetical protein